VLLGRCGNDWQETEYLLSFFGAKASEARRSYSAFVQQGVSAGRRPELVGGCLVRSLRGWKAGKASRGKEDPGMGDEAVLGDGDFVQDVLQGCRQ
jgi:putative transposase